MILQKLELRNFRSYDHLALEPSNGLNVIEGRNGSGKTNLVEAIYCLSMARSWRTYGLAALVKEGSTYAKIAADLTNGLIRKRVELLFSKTERRVLVNGKPIKRLSELSSLTSISLFSPKDVSLFQGSPGDRRNFLDMSISSKEPHYLDSVSRYLRLLSERNAVLKESEPNETQLDACSELMASECVQIIASRKRFIDELNKRLATLGNALYGSSRGLKIVYRPFVTGVDIKNEALSAFNKAKGSDILHKVTSVGVHREDFLTLLDGKDVGTYGSQGENRIAAIALKIAPSLIGIDEKPTITILDDVYSELDEEKAKNLSRVLKKIGQTFVTTTNTIVTGASYIEVLNHNAIRRN